MTEYFMLGGVELKVEVPTAKMDYQIQNIVKPYLNYPGAHIQPLPFDGKKLPLTVVVADLEDLETVRGFWKRRDPLPLVSLQEQAGYEILWIIDNFVQIDHDKYFKFEIDLIEYIEWEAETKKFIQWKVDTSKAKPKCPASSVVRDKKGNIMGRVGQDMTKGAALLGQKRASNTNTQQAINAAINIKNCVESSSSNSGKLSKCPTLKKGMRNSCVGDLQRSLRTHGFYLRYKGSLTKIDDYFGPITEDAVMNFQKKKKISPANGIVDSKTKAKL